VRQLWQAGGVRLDVGVAWGLGIGHLAELAELAERGGDLDLDRVLLVGHSAEGPWPGTMS